MPTEKEIARNAHIRRVLSTLLKDYNMDGCVLLCYHHTDDSHVLTHYPAGAAPAMEDVIGSLVRLIAVTAYDVGKADLKAQLDNKPLTNLDSEKV